MTLFSRLTAVVLLVACLPAVLSHGGGDSHGSNQGNNNQGNNCASNQFWYSKKSCCLPSGGVPSKPTPPSGSECPTSHYWSDDKQGCMPSHEDDDHNNCRKGWSWNDDSDCCKPSNPEPSKGYSSHHKRALSRAAPLCPSGLDACPIPGMEAGDYECLDTSSDLEACGGCPSLNQGEDCTAIPGAWNVACEERRCVVYSCAAGFMKSYDGTTCVSMA